MDARDQNAIGDAIVEACLDRYRNLLRTLVPQMGDKEATLLVLSATTAALVHLWKDRCSGEEHHIKGTLLAEIEQHWNARPKTVQPVSEPIMK